MAMTIMNDASASMTLGELNKNISELGKQLKKVSSGMRINGAGDGPSEFSISEKMRVRIRALDQDERNVLNGAALLRTAEGAIQSQIEIMKTIKQKVIDADNDTNTDLDRMTIQKEIDQGYQQIEDIAQETNYNGKRLLVGDKVVNKVFGWKVLDAPEMLEDSESMKIIETSANENDDHTLYAELDGQVGPFAVFNKYGGLNGSQYERRYGFTSAADLAPLFSSSSVKFQDGENGTPNKMTIDFSKYDSLDDLEGVGFHVDCVTSNAATEAYSYYYVLRKDPQKNYSATSNNGYTINVIDISGCNTMAEVANKVAGAAAKNYNNNSTNGASVTFTSKYPTLESNKNKIVGYKQNESTKQIPYREGAESSGISGRFSGGKDYVPGPDGHAAEAASFSFNGVDSSKIGTGICVNFGGTYSYIKFSEGSDGITYDSAAGIYRVGVNATTSKSMSGGYKFELSNGKLKLTANSTGSWINSSSIYTVSSGFSEQEASSITYSEISALKSEAISNEQCATEGTRAKTVIDLSGYMTNNMEMLDHFIDSLAGKALFWKGRGYYYDYYGFIDSKDKKSIDSIKKSNSSTAVDLNALRTAVQKGKTIAEAFVSLMSSKNSTAFSAVSSDGKVTGLAINAYNQGTAGNSEYAYAKEAKLNSFTIDFTSWFDSNGGATFPDALKDKGFRVYCATDPAQWFNFVFITGEDEEGRPKSGSSGADLYRIPINISEVTDAGSLVEAIYDQATPILTKMNHYLHVAADKDKGILTVYDDRYQVLTKEDFPNLQTKGAKIADGVLDDVQRTTRNIYVKDLVIQHTDHASQNIHVWVPQTTMDHLFGFIPGSRDISEFNVMTAENREALLGNKEGTARDGRIILKEEKGFLDTALDYLTSANTLIGAQISRLEMTQANIVTSRESTMNSESTIRDAAMAKEMAGYTKANVLAQAAQSMLAQANQNSSTILGLLQ